MACLVVLSAEAPVFFKPSNLNTASGCMQLQHKAEDMFVVGGLHECLGSATANKDLLVGKCCNSG